MGLASTKRFTCLAAQPSGKVQSGLSDLLIPLPALRGTFVSAPPWSLHFSGKLLLGAGLCQTVEQLPPLLVSRCEHELMALRHASACCPILRQGPRCATVPLEVQALKAARSKRCLLTQDAKATDRKAPFSLAGDLGSQTAILLRDGDAYICGTSDGLSDPKWYAMTASHMNCQALRFCFRHVANTVMILAHHCRPHGERVPCV